MAAVDIGFNTPIQRARRIQPAFAAGQPTQTGMAISTGLEQAPTGATQYPYGSDVVNRAQPTGTYSYGNDVMDRSQPTGSYAYGPDVNPGGYGYSYGRNVNPQPSYSYGQSGSGQMGGPPPGYTTNPKYASTEFTRGGEPADYYIPTKDTYSAPMPPGWTPPPGWDAGSNAGTSAPGGGQQMVPSGVTYPQTDSRGYQYRSSQGPGNTNTLGGTPSFGAGAFAPYQGASPVSTPPPNSNAGQGPGGGTMSGLGAVGLGLDPTVDRSKLNPYPAGWNPSTQPGQAYIPGKGWTHVDSGADVTWDAATNQSYYKGIPITDAEYQNLAQNGPNAMSGGQQSQTGFGTAEVQSNLANLGFGKLPTPIEAPQLSGNTPQAVASQARAGQVGGTSQITPAHVGAEQGGFSNFDELQNAMYESTYRPYERESMRNEKISDAQLNARLAQAGISESGTGIAQRNDLGVEYRQQRSAAQQDALNKAMVQRYGMEYTQSMDNAKLRQESNLANAGFDMTAQTANAQNLLTGNIANAQQATQAAIANAQMGTQVSLSNAQMQQARDLANAQNYLQAMGLNIQQAQDARQNYLSLLGLQEQDMQRMDTTQLNTLSLGYSTYLKQMGLMIAAGQEQFGKTDSSQSSTGINLGLGF